MRLTLSEIPHVLHESISLALTGKCLALSVSKQEDRLLLEEGGGDSVVVSGVKYLGEMKQFRTVISLLCDKFPRLNAPLIPPSPILSQNQMLPDTQTFCHSSHATSNYFSTPRRPCSQIQLRTFHESTSTFSNRSDDEFFDFSKSCLVSFFKTPVSNNDCEQGHTGTSSTQSISSDRELHSCSTTEQSSLFSVSEPLSRLSFLNIEEFEKGFDQSRSSPSHFTSECAGGFSPDLFASSSEESPATEPVFHEGTGKDCCPIMCTTPLSIHTAAPRRRMHLKHNTPMKHTTSSSPELFT